VTIKPRSSPYQRRQINHLATDGVLAKDRSGKGCASARVHVFIDNTPAERVYSAVGFTVARVRNATGPLNCSSERQGLSFSSETCS